MWQTICRKDSLLLRPLRIDNCQGDPRSPLLTRTNLSMLTVQGIFQKPFASMNDLLFLCGMS